MPSLIDIRRRIRAVKSTQQITKAMKMVAASRMRRAHDRIVNARPVREGHAARADQPGEPRRSRTCTRCWPSATTAKAGARIVAIVDHRRQGPGGQLQLEHREGGRPTSSSTGSISRSSSCSSAGRARDFFRRRAVTIARRAGRALHAADVTARRAKSRSGHRGVRERAGRRRVSSSTTSSSRS